MKSKIREFCLFCGGAAIGWGVCGVLNEPSLGPGLILLLVVYVCLTLGVLRKAIKKLSNPPL